MGWDVTGHHPGASNRRLGYSQPKRFIFRKTHGYGGCALPTPNRDIVELAQHSHPAHDPHFLDTSSDLRLLRTRP